MPSLRRIAHSMSLRETGSWMLCWIDVACEERPARACATACWTRAVSPVGGGACGTADAGGVSSEREMDAVAAPFLPLAVFFSFLSFLLAFLGASVVLS